MAKVGYNTSTGKVIYKASNNKACEGCCSECGDPVSCDACGEDTPCVLCVIGEGVVATLKLNDCATNCDCCWTGRFNDPTTSPPTEIDRFMQVKRDSTSGDWYGLITDTTVEPTSCSNVISSGTVLIDLTCTDPMTEFQDVDGHSVIVTPRAPEVGFGSSCDVCNCDLTDLATPVYSGISECFVYFSTCVSPASWVFAWRSNWSLPVGGSSEENCTLEFRVTVSGIVSEWFSRDVITSCLFDDWNQGQQFITVEGETHLNMTVFTQELVSSRFDTPSYGCDTAPESLLELRYLCNDDIVLYQSFTATDGVPCCEDPNMGDCFPC